jgi:hypothetical protein
MREKKYTVTFIDQFCFNPGEWTLPDYPLRGVYAQNEVDLSVHGWESFQPWLATIEGMTENILWNCAAPWDNRRKKPNKSGFSSDLNQ